MTPAQIECEAYLLQALGARFGILIEAYPATILRDRLSKSKTDLSRRDPSLHEPLSNLTIRLHPTNPNWVQIVKSNIKEALELEDTTHSLKPPSPPSNRR